jgi:hypothetical protein
MDKKIVFISHITEEKELAVKTKELIEESFLGMIEVFVSSDEHSISLGQKWLDNITESLKSCAVEIILCSPKSIKRPWINFEAGAGWIRDIPVIPFCHSGMKPSLLPMPLNLLQAANANEISSLKLLFPVLAHALGSKAPNVDFSTFVDSVKEFELKYTYWDELNSHLEKLNNYNNQIISALKNKQNIKIDLTETDINFFQDLMKFFTPKRLLDLKRDGDTKFTTTGTFYSCTISILENLNSIWGDENCKY